MTFTCYFVAVSIALLSAAGKSCRAFAAGNLARVRAAVAGGRLAKLPMIATAVAANGPGLAWLSLALCLAVDPGAVASRVWITGLAAAALLIALTPGWRPRLLEPLAAWVPSARATP